jgi:hypothetical protein
MRSGREPAPDPDQKKEALSAIHDRLRFQIFGRDKCDPAAVTHERTAKQR